MKKLFVFMVCLMFLASPVHAKSKGKKQKGSGGKNEAASSMAVDQTLSSDEKQVIENFFKKHKDKEFKKGKKKKDLPKGLQKKRARGGELPPGWQKKVAKGKVLDKDVLENSRPLPPELVRELPKQPPDTALVKVEDKIIRILKTTKEVLDVFDISF